MKYLPLPLCFHPAPAFSPSPRPVLLSRRGAHGDRQGALWQVWAGAVAAHAVHIGKEVAAHLLAGTAPELIMTSSKPAETQPWVGCCLVSRQLVFQFNFLPVFQVFVCNSAKYSDLGQPFGYLKASTALNCVNLFVMPYNYPVLLPLLGETDGSVTQLTLSCEERNYSFFLHMTMLTCIC